ncbi:hypothetical protein [Acetobacter fallax]|uniref:Glycosyltransferase RgtA/B/C/D-like domain-containing protein n=1 Tax=Acetobacter fallax TaxID=1737473 RepID=A0ABX0KCS0_9PROT|nr:hypothetical protein [Acetobacter fallax]NHO31757.1 hypothetical protein [Acetobacter fallax]NHO35316.1 hypothetical protein [Acetobacter fallax]
MIFRPGKTVDHKNGLFFSGIIILLLLTTVVQICLIGMPVTGDEPEYIYRALSFWRTGGFQMPTSEFAKEMPQFQALVASGFTPISGHPVTMSIIASPFTGLFGVAGARGISVLCALTSVVSLAWMLRPVAGPVIALLATAFVMLTFPVLPYTHLFYTELMMMALLAASWTCGRQNSTLPALAGILCALLLPFVHIRAALLSATLVLFALIHLWQRRDRNGLVAGAGLCAIAGGLFLWHQFAFYGHLVAGASASFQPSLNGVFDRLTVQLTEFRHGLLTVNPACLLAFAGLIIGAWKRSSLALQAILLLAVYLPPMIWGTASESWPARFWVPVMPTMAVGMAFWLRSVSGLPARLAGGALVLFAVLNSRILLHHNSKFLENRLGLLTGDEDFPFHDRFDVAGLLPWDSFDFAAFGIDPASALDETLLIRAALFWLALLVAFVLNGLLRAGRFPKLTTWLPALALLPLLLAATMRPVTASAFVVTRQDSVVTLSFNCPAQVRLIRISAPPRPQMIPPGFPAALDITTIRAADGNQETWRAPFAPVAGIPAGEYRTIRLTASGSGANGRWKNAAFTPLATGLRRLRCH